MSRDSGRFSVGALVLGVVIGFASRPALVPLAVLITGTLLLAGFFFTASRRRVELGVRLRERHVAVLSVSWVFVMVATNHNIADKAGAKAASAVLGLVVAVGYLSVGLLALMLIRSERTRLTVPAPNPTPLFVFAAWVIVSGFWAEKPGVGIAFGGCLLIIAFLARATIIVVVADRDDLERILVYVLRWYVWFCTVMCALGFLVGPLFVTVSAGNAGRWTWPAAHPGASALLLGAAFIILISAPKAVVAMPPVMRLGVGGMMAAGLYLNNSRTSALGAVAGTLVVIWLAGRRAPLLRVLGVPYFLATGGLLVLLAGKQVGQYVLRGGSADRLRNLNSRTQLWSIGFDALHTPLLWVRGLGHGATQYVFIDQGVAFAGNAHNSALALLVNDGLIGLGLALAAIVWAVIGAYRMLGTYLEPIAVPLFGVIVHLVANGVTSDALAEPNLGLAVVALLIACSIGLRAHEPAPGDRAAASETADELLSRRLPR